MPPSADPTPNSTSNTSTLVHHRHPDARTEPWAREFAQAIEVPPGAHTLVLSGVGPQVADAAAPPDTVAAYGDTATQTRSVLAQVEATLQQHGYGLGDIVSMQVLMVADPALGDVPDFEGFSRVYNQHFGTARQPRVPTRTRAQVLRLVPPGWLVEATVTAARVR